VFQLTALYKIVILNPFNDAGQHCDSDKIDGVYIYAVKMFLPGTSTVEVFAAECTLHASIDWSDIFLDY
jgi:hypothetical protein